MSKFPLFTGLAAVATLALGLSLTSRATADDHMEEAEAKPMQAQIGQPAPEFSLKDQEGNDVNLADHKGKIIVLEWFNDQCPYVKKWYGQGNMNTLASQYADKDVVWLAVDSSNFSSVEENAQIASEWKIDRPLLDDSEGKVGKMYGAKTTPHMYIIDTEGNLAYMGAIDDNSSSNTADIESATNYVAQALDELLAGESVSTQETRPYGCGVKF